MIRFQNDPHNTVDDLSEEDRASFLNLRVLRLTDLLLLTEKFKRKLLFDVKVLFFIQDFDVHSSLWLVVLYLVLSYLSRLTKSSQTIIQTTMITLMSSSKLFKTRISPKKMCAVVHVVLIHFSTMFSFRRFSGCIRDTQTLLSTTISRQLKASTNTFTDFSSLKTPTSTSTTTKLHPPSSGPPYFLAASTCHLSHWEDVYCCRRYFQGLPLEPKPRERVGCE